MCGLVSLIPRAAVVSTGPRTAPPPRVSAAGGLSEAARPLLDQHGYVLLEGLGSMMAGCTMIKFNSGTFGDSCATDMSEVRVLSRGPTRCWPMSATSGTRTVAASLPS